MAVLFVIMTIIQAPLGADEGGGAIHAADPSIGIESQVTVIDTWFYKNGMKWHAGEVRLLQWQAQLPLNPAVTASNLERWQLPASTSLTLGALS
jgi:hypothetical protein